MEAEAPEIEETSEEIVSISRNTEKERVCVTEDVLEVEAFTQEEVGVHLSDCEGQFTWLIWNCYMVLSELILSSLMAKVVHLQ